MDDNKLLEFWKMYIVRQENRSRVLYSTIYIYLPNSAKVVFAIISSHTFLHAIFFSQHEFAAKHKILFTCICIIMYNNNKRYYQELVFWHYQNPIIYQLSITRDISPLSSKITPTDWQCVVLSMIAVHSSLSLQSCLV